MNPVVRFLNRFPAALIIAVGVFVLVVLRSVVDLVKSVVLRVVGIVLVTATVFGVAYASDTNKGMFSRIYGAVARLRQTLSHEP